MRATCSTAPRERASRVGPSDAIPAPAAAPRDPFFDQPYEATRDEDAAPAWEAGVKAPPRAHLANIKPKRKVAALFKSEVTG